MYVNPNYAERDLSTLHDMIETVRFGTLVMCAGGPLAAHVPFVLNREDGPYGTLVAHVARADRIASVLDDGQEALAIFAGPSAYVTPRWCPPGSLPTYNYLAVHAHGCPRVLCGRDPLLAHLAELTEVHERGAQDPWSLALADGERVERLLPHIVAFTLAIDRIEGKRKLSQNRSAEQREGIGAGLCERGSDDDRAIAAAMAAYPYVSSSRSS
jgi:transcriptional regulator